MLFILCMFLQSIYGLTHALYGTPLCHVSTPTCFCTEIPSSGSHYNKQIIVLWYMLKYVTTSCIMIYQFYILKRFKTLIILTRRSRTYISMLAYIPLLERLPEDDTLVLQRIGVDTYHTWCVTEGICWMVYWFKCGLIFITTA
jgi:hypothetical protein